MPFSPVSSKGSVNICHLYRLCLLPFGDDGFNVGEHFV
jgi:hypothetical protein